MMQTEDQSESHSPRASAFPHRSFCSKYLYNRDKSDSEFPDLDERVFGTWKRRQKIEKPSHSAECLGVSGSLSPYFPALRDHQTRPLLLPSSLSEAQRHD